ncbi:MAG TPA: ABC transporter substrate-binding protein [Firmicutes bacterium]|nr:ABC transporter substrate-binding protein [Candidatus Fermentithermobacillaceae bacterium]
MAKSNQHGLMSKSKLLEVFDYLNERLRENQLQLEVTVYGGSIMTMVYDNRPATKDIDCAFSDINSKLLQNILDTVQYAFDLPDNWINEEIKEPLKHLIKEDKETYAVYSNLKILKPKAEQLLAMKVLAARPEPAKDFIDAYILCKDLNIMAKSELMDIVSTYIPLRLLGDRQMAFIKHLGKDLGYDWK